MQDVIQQLKISFKLLILLTVLTGLIYPLFITSVAQLFFSKKANGSIITVNDKAVGSELIGQAFTLPGYFWGRPSATVPYAYNAEHSTGSNQSVMNTDFLAIVKDRIAHFKAVDPDNASLIPVELVTASASGLDPEISPLAAYYQAPRVAKSRGLSLEKMHELIDEATQKRTLGIWGEPRVNVMQLNLMMDNLNDQITSRS